MDSRSAIIIGISIIVAAWIVALVGASGQSPTISVPAPSEAGRYQVAASGDASNGQVAIVDTQTGRCWLSLSGHRFTEITPKELGQKNSSNR